MKNRKSTSSKRRRRRSDGKKTTSSEEHEMLVASTNDDEEEEDSDDDDQKEKEVKTTASVPNCSTTARLQGRRRRSYVDLMVMNPDPPKKQMNSASAAKAAPASSSLRRRLAVEELLDRLESTGYTTVAITHTVYGAPRIEDDRIDLAFGDCGCFGNNKKRRKSSSSSLTILRRLHGVVENLSDVGMYAANSPKDVKETLNEYDLVSICPRNDASLQAACVSATGADIITLDFAGEGRSGGYLPFKIRPADAKVAVRRGVVFEIPYAPAVVNRGQRKGFVQACRELQTACLGLKPKVLLSSGRRFDVVASEDAGPMALRMPGDLTNLFKVVAGFDERTSIDALGKVGYFALEKAHKRRYGSTVIAGASVLAQDSSLIKVRNNNNNNVKKVVDQGEKQEEVMEKGSDDDNEIVEDGFISL